jgi:UDP-3-O-[3-hydroxymyristoyl] N-acetylglucosamine deacetylase
VRAIREAGWHEHDVPREYIHIVKPVTVSHQDKRISVHPCGEYRVTYAIDFDHPALGYQELTASLRRADQFADVGAGAHVHLRARGRSAEEPRIGAGRLPGERRRRGGAGILNPPLRFPTNSSATRCWT